MTKPTLSLLAALLLAGAPLAGCEAETQTEIESDGDVDRDVEIGLDDAAIEEAQSDARNLGDEIEDGAQVLGNEIDQGADAVGGEIEEGAAAVGAAARNAAEVIDENVDLGDNAGTPEAGDDN